MPLKDLHEAENRLRANPDRITPQEWRDLMQWIPDASGLAIKRVDAELALQNIEAVQKFERSSSKRRFFSDARASPPPIFGLMTNSRTVTFESST
jgi:hypothetical protein